MSRTALTAEASGAVGAAVGGGGATWLPALLPRDLGRKRIVRSSATEMAMSSRMHSLVRYFLCDLFASTSSRRASSASTAVVEML